MQNQTLYSTRRKQREDNKPDQYKALSNNLKIQITQILVDAIGDPRSSEHSANIYQNIHDDLCKKFGLSELIKYERNIDKSIINFFMKCVDLDTCLDIIELSMRYIDTTIRQTPKQFQLTYNRIKTSPDQAIEKLNYRFDAAAVAYQLVSGEIIRKDNVTA